MRSLSQADSNEARKPFYPVPRAGAGATPEDDAVGVIRESFAALAEHITAHIRHSRNRSLALTHLEDACDRAVKAIYHDGLNT